MLPRTEPHGNYGTKYILGCMLFKCNSKQAQKPQIVMTHSRNKKSLKKACGDVLRVRHVNLKGRGLALSICFASDKSRPKLCNNASQTTNICLFYQGLTRRIPPAWVSGACVGGRVSGWVGGCARMGLSHMLKRTA